MPPESKESPFFSSFPPIHESRSEELRAGPKDHIRNMPQTLATERSIGEGRFTYTKLWKIKREMILCSLEIWGHCYSTSNQKSDQ